MTSISRFDGPIWEDQRMLFIPENLDRAGATRLAAKIERFWAKQGKDVKCRLEMVVGVDSKTMWAVRSSLVNGLPR